MCITTSHIRHASALFVGQDNREALITNLILSVRDEREMTGERAQL
jgi:hypothetical protein